jgi:hypothetical protein
LTGGKTGGEWRGSRCLRALDSRFCCLPPTLRRDVGYSIEKIELSDEIHAISATKIRKEMGIS